MYIYIFDRTIHKICLLVHCLYIYVNILYLKIRIKVVQIMDTHVYIHGIQRKMLVSSLP